MITGIKWFSELIETAGRTDISSTLASNKSATDRVVTSEEVIEAAPDIIMASWCGKKLRLETFGEREGWSVIQVVQQNRSCEVKSPFVSKPGPAAFRDGLSKLVQIWSSRDHSNPRPIRVYRKTFGAQSGAVSRHTLIEERSITTHN